MKRGGIIKGIVKKKKLKKTEFYLMAAIIIIIIVIGVATVSNYVITKPKPVKVYDLSEEFGSEIISVEDYSIYQEENETELIENFTKMYWEEVDPSENIEFMLVLGNKEGYTVIRSGEETIETGVAGFKISTQRMRWSNEQIGHICEGGVCRVNVDEETEIDFRLNERFRLVVKVKKEGETHVPGGG